MSPGRTASPRSKAESPTPRRYESPLRAQRAEETRTKLIATATELFVSNGWANTGMRDVAREAGVAVETLYKHYSSKRVLLNAVIDNAVAGDDEPVPVAERPQFLALGRGRRSERITAAASIITTIHGRTAPFAKLIREAACTDSEIAEVLRATRERQRLDVEAGVHLVLDRPPTDEERDGVWAILSPEVYLLLVEETGWTVEHFERWMAETLTRVLPRS